MSATNNQTDPVSRLTYAGRSEIRGHGFISAHRIPAPGEGHEAMEEAMRTFAEQRGVEFDGDSL